MTDSTYGGADGVPARAPGAKGPDELRQQIEQTRRLLGDTVEELAAKADVKGRARARAAGLRDRAGELTVQLRSSAAHVGHRAQERATGAGHRVHERVAHAGHGAREAPGPPGRPPGRSVQGRVRGAVQTCRRNPRPLMIVGVAGAAVLAAGLLMRRRRECH
jgi:hypothetical protein